MLSIEKLTEEVDEILYDESGLSYKIRALEKNNEVEEKVSLKTKAMWAMLGAILTFLASFGAKVVEIFLK